MIDVVVVGGGLAGLAAAHALRDRAVLIVEREDRLGGRVKSHGALPLGACFAFPADAALRGAALGRRVQERGPIELHLGGERYVAETAIACMDLLPCASALLLWRAGMIPASALPADALAALNAFFRQIHPGDVRDYVPKRQRDAAAEIYPDRYEAGNDVVIDAYRCALGERTELALGRTVVAIDERADAVRVAHEGPRARDRGTVECAAVIVATTADVARGLVPPACARAGQFLDAVRYGAITVVAFEESAPIEARCVLNPDGVPDVIFRQGSGLVCYCMGERAESAARLADRELIERTADGIERMGYARPKGGAAARWSRASTILSPDYQRAKAAGSCQASPRIFLAGDYVWPDPAWGYGVRDAVNAGRAAAERVREALVP